MLHKVVAMPDKKEQSEKINVAGRRIFLLDPIKSETELNIHPDSAQVIARMDTINPISALLSFMSGAHKREQKHDA